MNGLMEPWLGFTLLDPWMLLWSLLVPLGFWLRHRRGIPAIAFAPEPFIGRGDLRSTAPVPGQETVSTPALPRSWRVWVSPSMRLAQAASLVLVVFALARPAQRVALPLKKEGIDIFLCIDVSSSMAAKDMDPKRSRLALVKDAAARFVAGRSGDRIGLVRFARFPDLICPLTLDHVALEGFIDGLTMVEPDGDEDLTGIGTAVARSAQVLRDSLAKSKVVILLTDGEENVATDQTPEEIGPARAARLCEGLGVRVYTIATGIGKRRSSGEWVAIDTDQVSSLAQTTGGSFYEARDAGAIDKVYATIDELEKVEFEDPRYELREGFLPFLISAITLWLVSLLLRSGRLSVLP